LRVEYAELSLQGGRDPTRIASASPWPREAALLIACDGMGGHAEGERAAEIAQQTVIERFWQTTQPLIDPLGFLHLALGAAHGSVVGAGAATAAGDAAARHLRGVRGAADFGLLGAYRR
jgi:serine/threonine protein phosphatase PrpC